MREIKFRVWDSISKVMHQWNTIDCLPMRDFITLEHYILMQYTGLKDKNGKEIYEGDIIKFHIFTQELGEGYGVCEGEREWIGKIAIEPFGVWLESDTEEKSGYMINWYGTHEESIEVIGNIYENPELLTN